MQQRPSSDFYNFSLYHWEATTPWQPDSEALNRPVWVLLKAASDSELALLHKILAAVPLEVEQTCSITTEAGPLQYKDLVAHATKLQTHLVNGRTPSELCLHLQLPTYLLTTFQGILLLFADELATIAANEKAEKQRLWKQVQQLRTT